MLVRILDPMLGQELERHHPLKCDLDRGAGEGTGPNNLLCCLNLS